MNRFSRISQATYTPLSLQEIMAVPLAKQAQHDQLQAQADEMNALSATVSQADKERIGGQVSALQSRADDISTGLGESGITSDLKSKFRRLRSDKAKAYGADGDIGFAQADYARQAKYMSDMTTDKDMQAGWSAQEAQGYAAQQISDYGSSFNEDGTRKAGFSGKTLAAKVGESEWLRDHVGDIEHQISNKALRVIKRDGLPAFQLLVQQGDIEYKDLNTVMGYLANSAYTDPALMASLQQQAEFNGEENWSDFGNFEEKIVKDSNGKNVKQTTFVPGTSRFGRKMAGMGEVSSYYRENIEEKLLEDKTALSLYEMGMEERNAVSLVDILTGEGVNPKDVPVISEIKEDLDIYIAETDAALVNLQTREQNLKKEFMSSINPDDNMTDEAIEKALDKVLMEDRPYQKLKSQYDQSAVKSSRSKTLLDSITKRVNNNYLSKNDKLAVDVISQMNTPEEIFALYKKTFNEDFKGSERNAYRPMSKHSGRVYAFGEEKSEEQANLDKQVAAMAILKKKGVDVSEVTNENIVNAFDDFRKNLTRRQDEGHEKLLKVEKYALHYKNLTGEDEGKNASEIGRINKLKTSNFNKRGLAGQMLAFNGGKGEDVKLENLVGEFGTDDAPKALEYSYTLSGTGSHDHTGEKFSEVGIYNPNTQQRTTIQVIDNDVDNIATAARQLAANGTPAQVEEANSILASLLYMPAVKRSDMTYSDSGIVDGLKLSTPDGKDSVNIEWKKIRIDGTDPFFTANAGGEEITFEGKNQISSEIEMVLAINEFIKAKEEAYIIQEQNKKQ